MNVAAVVERAFKRIERPEIRAGLDAAAKPGIVVPAVERFRASLHGQIGIVIGKKAIVERVVEGTRLHIRRLSKRRIRQKINVLNIPSWPIPISLKIDRVAHVQRRASAALPLDEVQ